jgi:hypothetical protein
MVVKSTTILLVPDSMGQKCGLDLVVQFLQSHLVSLLHKFKYSVACLELDCTSELGSHVGVDCQLGVAEPLTWSL